MVHPDSSSGHSGSVYIRLTGKGQTVNDWETSTAVVGPALCTYAVFWAPANTIAFTGQEDCGSANSVYYWAYQNVVFNYNPQACNTWVSLAGKPCENVHR